MKTRTTVGLLQVSNPTPKRDHLDGIGRGNATGRRSRLKRIETALYEEKHKAHKQRTLCGPCFKVIEYKPKKCQDRRLRKHRYGALAGNKKKQVELPEPGPPNETTPPAQPPKAGQNRIGIFCLFGVDSANQLVDWCEARGINYPVDHILKFTAFGSKIAKWRKNDNKVWIGRDCKKIEISFACDKHADSFFAVVSAYTKTALCPKSARVGRKLVDPKVARPCVACSNTYSHSVTTLTRPNPIVSRLSSDKDRKLNIPAAAKGRTGFATIQCYNIQSLCNKEWKLSELVKRHKTSLIVLSEARSQHDLFVTSKLHSYLPNYTLMNGKKSTDGGVCLLACTSLLESHTRIEFFNDNPLEKTHGNGVILRLSPKRGRKPAILGFYGRAGRLSEKVSKEQWNDFGRDVEKFCTGFEMYWLGEFTTRPGRGLNSNEQKMLGRFGERLPRGRDSNTQRFLGVTAKWHMIRLSGQIRQKFKTHRQIGREHASSSPDDIWVSETLFLRGMRARVVPCTLSSHESHNLVTASVRLHRRPARRPRRRPRPARLRHSTAGLRTKEGRQEFHEAVVPRLPSTETIMRLPIDEIATRVFENQQRSTCNEQAETFVDPRPTGLVTNAAKSLRKHEPHLEKAHRAFQESGAVRGSVEHDQYKKAIKKRDELAARVKEAEQKTLHRQLEKCRVTGDFRRFHKATRDKRKGKHFSHDVSSLVDDTGAVQTSNEAIARAMIEYVSRLYYGHGPLTDRDLAVDESKLPLYHPLCDQAIVEEETVSALSRLKPRKAVGLDGLHAEMFIGALPLRLRRLQRRLTGSLAATFPPDGKQTENGLLLRKAPTLSDAITSSFAFSQLPAKYLTY